LFEWSSIERHLWLAYFELEHQKEKEAVENAKNGSDNVINL